MARNPPRSASANILIVDDTPANLRLLSQMLGEHGYTSRPVADGELALAAAKAQAPVLILLDIRMPGLSGYEVCAQLKTDPRTCEIPIIFISALDQAEDKVKAFDAGGVDYVTKPFQVEEVLARVQTHLALRELQKRLEDANEKMARELALAGELQAGFLPRRLPDMPGWQVAATLSPAREMSGDFYDFIWLPDGKLGVVIADVSDKGAAAALYMALCCTLIRTYAAEHPTRPELVFRDVNQRMVSDTRAEQFVTVFYGVLDPATGTLTYANAGHPPPYLARGQGDEVASLGPTGMVLGMMEGKGWTRASVELARGDALVIYTDGVTEAVNAAEEQFGAERLMASVRTHRARPARELRDALLADLRGFVGPAPPADDIAVAVLVRGK